MLFFVCFLLDCVNTYKHKCLILVPIVNYLSFFCIFDGKASAYNAGDLSSIPGSGRFSGEENGNPLQYSCLGNPMDGKAW